MGWTLPSSTSSPGYTTPSSPTVLTSPMTVTLPSAMQAGDDVWLAICSKTAILSGPTGFSLIGSEVNIFPGALNSASNFFSVWRRTAQAGDPTTVTVTDNTGGAMGYNAFLVRSTSGSPGTIVTDAVQSGSSTTPTYGPFNPTTALADLRILFHIIPNPTGLSNTGIVAPASATDGNPSQTPIYLLESWGFQLATSLGAYTYITTVPTDADGSSINLTTWSSTVGWYTRYFDLNDGTTVGGGNADEETMGLVTVDVTGASPSSDNESISAAAGKFGGGAHVL